MDVNQLQFCNEKLDKIYKLDYNWDLYEAEPINKDLINVCRNIIDKLDYMPEIFPTACNSIQFEYENENGDYLEIEFVENNMVKIFLLKHDGSEMHSAYNVDYNIINRITNGFYNGGYRNG